MAWKGSFQDRPKTNIGIRTPIFWGHEKNGWNFRRFKLMEMNVENGWEISSRRVVGEIPCKVGVKGTMIFTPKINSCFWFP